ncbi:hypothetical protein CSPX01_09472 [Colletotrichum filicis]|nr:hypothetical protein CSPX01_09472 [Colletotrichum filicis]
MDGQLAALFPRWQGDGGPCRAQSVALLGKTRARPDQFGNGGSSLLCYQYVFFSCNDAGGDVKLGSSLNLQDNPHTPPSQSSPSNNGPEPFLSPPSHGCHFCAVNQLRTFCKPRNASEPACQWPPSSVTFRCFVRILSLHLI